MKRFGTAAFGVMLMVGAAALVPAKADVGIGFSFGYDGGYFSNSCDYYDYYDVAPPWGMPPDYCEYPVYFDPIFWGGSWYRGPIYYRWYGGERLYWLNGGWRRDEWRGARPSIRWSDRGGWRGGPAWGGRYGAGSYRGYDRDNRGWSSGGGHWQGGANNWSGGGRGWSGGDHNRSGGGNGWSGQGGGGQAAPGNGWTGGRGGQGWSGGHGGGWSGGGQGGAGAPSNGWGGGQGGQGGGWGGGHGGGQGGGNWSGGHGGGGHGGGDRGGDRGGHH